MTVNLPDDQWGKSPSASHTAANSLALENYLRDQREHKRRQPSQHVKQSVRKAFDADALKRVCALDDFTAYAERYDLEPAKDGHKRFYYYADNGADVLAIAHLDTVQAIRTCQVVETNAGLLALSGGLDDRLGAYVILEMLPRLDIACDWLLTTDEEICASTADEFFPEKRYNWMFQFDRGGSDVVMYQYETPELKELVERAGAIVGVGSFSDICLLDHLDVAGFNWGVGYQDYHGPKSHAWLEETFRMVARFVKFYRANATTPMPVAPWSPQRPNGFDDWDDDDSWVDYRDIRDGRDDWNRWAVDVSSQAIVVADCGHEVDLGDDRSFVESDGGSRVECTDCATPRSS